MKLLVTSRKVLGSFMRALTLFLLFINITLADIEIIAPKSYGGGYINFVGLTSEFLFWNHEILGSDRPDFFIAKLDKNGSPDFSNIMKGQAVDHMYVNADGGSGEFDLLMDDGKEIHLSVKVNKYKDIPIIENGLVVPNQFKRASELESLLKVGDSRISVDGKEFKITTLFSPGPSALRVEKKRLNLANGKLITAMFNLISPLYEDDVKELVRSNNENYIQYSYHNKKLYPKLYKEFQNLNKVSFSTKIRNCVNSFLNIFGK